MLPLELIELIFSKVKDKKTILSLRMTNKHFYNIFKNVIDVENKKKYVFNPNGYQKFNLDTNLLESDIVFKYPCFYIYKEYNVNKMVKRQIISSLFEMEKKDFILYSGFKKKKYNIYNDTTSETTVTYPMIHNCNIM